MPKEKEESSGPIAPDWFTQGFVNRFQSQNSSVFIFHGEVNCLLPNPYVEDEPQWPYISFKEVLERVFDDREMVIFYSIASGPRFLNPSMEKVFKKVAELEKEGDPDPKDAVAAAKAGLAAKRQIPKDPESCLPLIEKVLQKMDSVVLIIESAHFIVPESSNGTLSANERVHIERIRRWAQDRSVKKRTNIVLLLTDVAAKISGELRQSTTRISSVFVPKPTSEERAKYIERLTKGTPAQQELEKQETSLNRKRKTLKNDAARETIESALEEIREKLSKFPSHFEVPDDFEVDMLVSATQGMSLRQILEIFRTSRQDEKPIDLLYVRNKKREILNAEYGEVMEIVDPDWGLEDIGGLDYIKEYFSEIIDAIKKGNAKAIPQGITLMGPPGTGKTALVEALARDSGYNFVQLRNARSMWVGQSEERTERQQQGLMALAPVVVMNDEADLGEANRDSPKGDSGVSERIMQAWMKFLSDPRIQGKVLMVNCTNRPDRMDAAMKRSGRSDDRIALLMPPADERDAIFAVMFRKYNIKTSIKKFTRFSEMTEGLSGADIRKIVLESSKFADRRNLKEVNETALREAIEDFIPSASQVDIDLMTLLAISESSSRRLLPKHIVEIVKQIKKRNLVADCEEMIAQLEARKVIDLGKASPMSK